MSGRPAAASIASVKFSVTLGACVYRERALEPGDVRDIATLVCEAGRDLAGYDIKVSGNTHQLSDFATAGATWWGQWIPPGRRILRHPDPLVTGLTGYLVKRYIT